MAFIVSVAKASETDEVLQAIQKSLSAQEEKIKDFQKLQTIVNEQKNTLQDLQNEMTKLNESKNVKKLTSSLENQHKKLDVLTNKISNLESSSTSNKKLSKDVEDLKSQLSKQQKKLKNKNSKEMGQVGSKMSSLEEQLRASKEKINSMNEKISHQDDDIKNLNRKYIDLLKKFENFKGSSEGTFLNSMLSHGAELQELIVRSYGYVVHDLLIKMGFDPNDLSATSKQFKNYFNIVGEKCNELFVQSQSLGTQGVEYAATAGGHLAVYWNILLDHLPVVKESVNGWGQYLHENGSGYASVVGEKATELGKLASAKVQEISLEDIKQSSLSAAQKAQTHYYDGKEYVTVNYPQVGDALTEARTQVTGLNVIPAEYIELLIDLTVIFSLLLTCYIIVKLSCCLLCRSCRRKKAPKKPAAPKSFSTPTKTKQETQENGKKGKKGKKNKKGKLKH